MPARNRGVPRLADAKVAPSHGDHDMPANSGNGGKITVGAVDLHVTRWRLNHGTREADITSSASGGFTRFAKVVTNPEWTAEGWMDEDNLPDVDAGAVVGTDVTIVFKEGADSRTITLTNTYVSSLEIVVDNTNDVVRFTASGKGCTAMTNHAT